MHSVSEDYYQNTIILNKVKIE